MDLFTIILCIFIAFIGLSFYIYINSSRLSRLNLKIIGIRCIQALAVISGIFVWLYLLISINVFIENDVIAYTILGLNFGIPCIIVLYFVLKNFGKIFGEIFSLFRTLAVYCLIFFGVTFLIGVVIQAFNNTSPTSSATAKQHKIVSGNFNRNYPPSPSRQVLAGRAEVAVIEYCVNLEREKGIDDIKCRKDLIYLFEADYLRWDPYKKELYFYEGKIYYDSLNQWPYTVIDGEIYQFSKKFRIP